MEVVPSIFGLFLRQLPVALVLLLGASVVRAVDLLAQALGSLPANTVSIERDKLKQLRTLPNYDALERMYSGRTFKEARKAITEVGIAPSDLDEVVIAFDGTGYYGLATGLFDRNKAQRLGVSKGWQSSVSNGIEILCSGGGSTCLAFPAESLLAFGTAEQIKEVMNVRSRRDAALRSNSSLLFLLALADRDASVMGVAPGTELKSWIGDAVPAQIMSQENLAKALRTIEFFQYNVRFDEKAHLVLHLQCQSALGADSLSAALNTVKAMQVIGSKFGGVAMPFENMSAHANGSLVALQLDTAIPAN